CLFLFILIVVLYLFFFFFFSSRRRHTRCLSDWSSDVCSSDLTLRLEVCYPLNGSDLSPERNPIEAGLGFFVDLTKPNFIGREVLVKAKENGSPERLVAFRMQTKGPPPRPHYSVFDDGNRIGEVTSGTLSPSL